MASKDLPQSFAGGAVVRYATAVQPDNLLDATLLLIGHGSTVNADSSASVLQHAAALRDAGLPCLKECCMAKLVATDMAEQVCSDAIQTLGGYGYLADFPVERIYRDVRVSRIYEGTNDIQHLVIARELARGS